MQRPQTLRKSELAWVDGQLFAFLLACLLAGLHGQARYLGSRVKAGAEKNYFRNNFVSEGKKR